MQSIYSCWYNFSAHILYIFCHTNLDKHVRQRMLVKWITGWISGYGLCASGEQFPGRLASRISQPLDTPPIKRRFVYVFFVYLFMTKNFLWSLIREKVIKFDSLITIFFGNAGLCQQTQIQKGKQGPLSLQLVCV